MLQLRLLRRKFVKSEGLFRMVSPSPFMLLKFKCAAQMIMAYNLTKTLLKKQPPAQKIGEFIAYTAIGYTLNPVKFNIRRMYSIIQSEPKKPLIRKNGIGGRSPLVINPLADADINGRVIRKGVIVYHDANRALKHIDVHLGRWSFVYRISGKEVENKIRFNKDGYLTDDSKKALLNHLRQEIANNSRTPQNLDHSVANAKMSWVYNPDLSSETTYGSGPTRQIIAEGDIEFYHHSVQSSMHIYAPFINADQGLYLYQLYPGSDTKAPICILGNLIPRDTKFEDRLHLTMVNNFDQFLSKIDFMSLTKKEDGASCYFSSTNEGFKFFSPRISKITNHRIEYTYKIPELAEIGNNNNVVGMGELLFWRQLPLNIIFNIFGIKGPEKISWDYLSAPEIGGILNSNKIRPKNIYPELRIYRIDKWNGIKTTDLPFWENRNLQEKLIDQQNNPFLKTVKLTNPKNKKNYEGFVGVPEGLSVNDGLKFKFRENDFDWKIDSINFYLSEKGNISGVVSCTSLESGKKFNLGPNSMGTADDCIEMMNNPDNYIGKVIKVSGFNGHEGRGSRLISYHLDKGI